jgi:hypothetical protein
MSSSRVTKKRCVSREDYFSELSHNIGKVMLKINLILSESEHVIHTTVLMIFLIIVSKELHGRQ